MADLMNPDGYRHIDDSGIIHPASTIKCQIMEYAFLEIHKGNADVRDMAGGLSLQTRIERMIRVTCNDSTAFVIAHFGRAAIDAWLMENYKNTRLYSDFAGYNHENKYNATCVEDNIDFLERMFQNRHSGAYKDMFEVMVGTETRAKIPAATDDLPNVGTANKTGSFYDSTYAADHDIAVVFGTDENGEIIFAYALAIYTFSGIIEATYSAARPAIISMSRDIYERVKENHEKFALYYSENPGARQ
jgi:hypothetical protein